MQCWIKLYRFAIMIVPLGLRCFCVKLDLHSAMEFSEHVSARRIISKNGAHQNFHEASHRRAKRSTDDKCWKIISRANIKRKELDIRNITVTTIENKSASKCKRLCKRKTREECNSFEYILKTKTCVMSAVKLHEAEGWSILNTRRWGSVFLTLQTCDVVSACGQPMIAPDLTMDYLKVERSVNDYLGTSYDSTIEAPQEYSEQWLQFDTDIRDDNIVERSLYDEELYELPEEAFDNVGRIVGGSVARPGSWPWQVQIKAYDRHLCGGSVIGNYWVVTAAHCFVTSFTTPVEAYTVHAGSSNKFIVDGSEQVRKVKRIVKHENFSQTNLDQDIALIELTTGLDFTSDNIVPICLPNVNVTVKPGTICYVTGFGTVLDTGNGDVLKQAGVPIKKREKCVSKYEVTDSMLCAGHEAGGHDACQGDSGGPLVCKSKRGGWFLYGIVSWGEGCAKAKKPGFYTKVGNYFDWVKQLTNL